MTLFRLIVFLFGSACFTVAGCGSNPTLYEVKGRVTLDGKPHERLLVYFRPVSGESTAFNNAVGETDADGNLTVKSSGGNGLETGEYKVSFSYQAPVKQTAAAKKLTSDDKPDEMGIKVVEMVPDVYAEGKTIDSEVRFKVTSGENVFEYDIPAK